MILAAHVTRAARAGASDLHIEGGLPLTVRVRGALKRLGDPLPARTVLAMAREVVGEAGWPGFLERRSADLALGIAGVRCRVNVLRTARGVGLAVRLLPSGRVTIEGLNLHPDLRGLVGHAHGLVIVSGPTGCGKSSTLAALVDAINDDRAAHIVTVEQPIEYDLVPRRAFVRQREVGRDSPSFEQALLDAMREDIDVLMVGEMRERETMRLTLDACETGHLVLATMHSSTTTEALQRLVAAFPASEQPSVCAQLADVLVGVVCQRLQWRQELGLRVPECELLLGTTAVRSIVRSGQLFKLQTVLETGGRQGLWTLDRYRSWLDGRQDWVLPDAVRGAPSGPDAEDPAGVHGEVIVIPDEGDSIDDVLSELDRG